MRQISETLRDLDDPAAVARVIHWIAGKYGAQIGAPQFAPISSGKEAVRAVGIDGQTYESIADLFDAANPSTEAEKVLVISYWFQEIEGQGEIESQAVNAELKNLGHGVGNITRALGTLITKKPRLVIQTRKSGTSKQARKRFKVTVEGIKFVRSMLSGGPDEL